MDSIEDKLQSLGVSLPEMPSAKGNYLPYLRAGNLLFLAGALPTADGNLVTGKIGATRPQEDGYQAARLCGLSQLAVLKTALGSLERIKQIVTLTGFVNAAPDFTAIPEVINGASDLLVEIFGDAGRHARAAVGVASLPKGAIVEVQMTVEAFP